MSRAGTAMKVLPGVSRTAEAGRGKTAVVAAPLLVPPPAMVLMVFGVWAWVAWAKRPARTTTMTSAMRRMQIPPNSMKANCLNGPMRSHPARLNIGNGLFLTVSANVPKVYGDRCTPAASREAGPAHTTYLELNETQVIERD